jgi:DNA-binding GntR family transcriptional regulator
MSAIASIAPIASPQTRTDEAYVALKRMIVQREFKPGEWLRRRTVSGRLKLSATPVVEALRRLEQEGLVEMVPQWGARVRTFSVDELEQMFHMRSALEATVFRRLAARLSDVGPKVEALRPLAKQIDGVNARIVAQPDVKPTQEEVDRDILFHLTLAETSGWGLIAREIERLQILRNTIVNLKPNAGLVVTHEDLLDSILTGDATRAEQAIRYHIESRIAIALRGEHGVE